MITSLEISNFKSFDDSVIHLAPFSVFIGPNGAGKTNLIDAFKFLKEAMNENLTVAINRRHGWQGIRCRKRRRHHIAFTLGGKMFEESLQLRMGNGVKAYKNVTFDYTVSFYGEQEGTYTVVEEQGRVSSYGAQEQRTDQEYTFSDFARKQGEIIVKDEHNQQLISVPDQNRDRLFLGSRFFSIATIIIGNEIERWRVYDPDPEDARMPRMAQDVSFISEKGETLALVLHQIQDHSGDGSDNEGFRSKLLNVMRMFVPGFEDWMTEHLIDGRISYKIKEKALKGALPPSLISDGTIRLLTLLTALLYNRDRPSTVFIEEPERGLHPLVMQQLVELMREVSRDFQVIVTTHSPDFVRYCRPEEVYFVDKVDGLTQIVRAQDVEQIEQFLQSFTLDQLWLQGYIEKGLPM